MKIDGTSLSPVGSVQAANRVSQVEKKPPELGKDNLAVSDKAQVYQALLQKVKEVTEIREDRVADLQERIAKGQFKVDAQAIADNMIREGGEKHGRNTQPLK